MHNFASKYSIWDAARRGDVSALSALLEPEGVDVDEPNDFGNTALHVAAALGRDDAVQLLLEHGADVLAPDWESGWTPLHRSLYGRHLTTSLLLLRHGRARLGRQFFSKQLHETKDHDGLSAMDIASALSTGSAEEHQRHGAVYTFGKVDFQLGYHLPNADVQSTPRMVELPVTVPIAQISAHKYHTLAVNTLGQVFAWGFGKGGRLGTGTEYDHVEPALLEAFDQIEVTKVAAGENHSLALTATGQVYSWGANSFGQLGQSMKTCTSLSRLAPKRIDAFRGMVVTEIAASSCHSAAITDNGDVYTWGSNRKGQLGRKDGFGTDQPHSHPKRVDALVPGHPLSVVYDEFEDVQAVQVALSEVHTCVVLRCTRNSRSYGEVCQFGYGFNCPSRLNFKDRKRSNSLLMDDAWMPTWKQLHVDIVKISCASQHSIALSSTGVVYTWGHNASALSHGKHPKDFAILGVPQPVNELKKYGSISSGVLGHGMENTWQPCPKRVRGAKKVVDVAAGHQHTVVLMAPIVPTWRNTDDENAVPGLMDIAQKQIANYMDVTNAATIWKYAESFCATALERHCAKYLRHNWDAILELAGKEKMDGLFDLFLIGFPEVKCPSNRPKASSVATRPAASVVSLISEKKKAEKPAKTLKSSASREDETAVVKDGDDDVSKSDSKNALQIAPSPPPEDVTSASKKTSKRRNTRFVSIDDFFTVKKTESTRSTVGLSGCPWNTSSTTSTPPKNPSVERVVGQFPSVWKEGAPKTASPSLTYASPKQVSASAKAVLCGDGIERVQMTTFTLDSFLKCPRKGKKKGHGILPDEPKPMWAADAPSAKPARSLKEIQAEEEARAAAEAAANARAGGFARRLPTVNSWGLCEAPSQIPLVDIQKLQEYNGPLDLHVVDATPSLPEVGAGGKAEPEMKQRFRNSEQKDRSKHRDGGARIQASEPSKLTKSSKPSKSANNQKEASIDGREANGKSTKQQKAKKPDGSKKGEKSQGTNKKEGKANEAEGHDQRKVKAGREREEGGKLPKRDIPKHESTAEPRAPVEQKAKKRRDAKQQTMGAGVRKVNKLTDDPSTTKEPRASKPKSGKSKQKDADTSIRDPRGPAAKDSQHRPPKDKKALRKVVKTESSEAQATVLAA